MLHEKKMELCNRNFGSGNSIQLAEVMRSNPDYMTGLIIALIGSVLYGIVNIR